MREILFRGKAINRNPHRVYRTDYKNGDWVYGLIERFVNEEYTHPASMINTDGISDIDVDYRTISEYTGLKDKNGTKIFEGDIVYCEARLDSADMVVIFECGQFRLIPCERYKSYQISMGYYDINCFSKEVIGNIHDNPELLKESDKE